MKLYICEKPSQAKDLARVLGLRGNSKSGFIGNSSIAVTWAIGHLIQQLDPDEVDAKYSKWNMEHLPIVPRVWEMKPNPKTKKQLNIIKGLLQKSNHVVIATDGDREGEVIGRELIDYFNWTGTGNINRLWLTALDDNSIQKALNNLKQGSETEPLYYAGLARARADWMVGMSATRALSLMAQGKGYRGVLSVGRVQTPTLAIVVNRDIEIENFKPKDYYDIRAEFSGISAKWIPEEGGEYCDDENRCIDEQYVNHICNNIRKGSATVVKFATQRKKVPPPLLYSIDFLQEQANKKFGFSSKQVLDLAQSLYEKHKATTYPRSDCQYLPLSQLSEVKDVMTAISSIDSNMGKLISNADLTIQSKVWNDKKLGAHHGIIPTDNRNVDMSSMTTDECKLYDLICRSYIAQFYPNYEYDKTDIEINASNEIFKNIVNLDVNLGWKIVTNSQAELKQGVVPNLENGQTLSVDGADVETKQTKPPARYSEGSLVKAMKNAHQFVTDVNLKKILKGDEGIGTSATRANIIDLLKKRNFLLVKKKQIISTDTGRALISAVPSAVKDPGMTAIMESSLSKIASGELTLEAFMDWQVDWLGKLIESIKSQTISIESNIKTIECPDCGKHMFLRNGKKGQFWGCSGYPECKTMAQNNGGKAVFEKDMPDCPECGKKLRRIKGKKGFFWSCSGYFDTPKCEFTAQDKAGKAVFE
ncbi:DNA topoisomerase III [hydrothermal vent metagenome]|uniref:DNA topoisomerase n=1 Tax=hydrothermal vent metagenome TaxID=652676 RepID=A0A1W1E6Y6_9ZZZZ